MQAKIHYILLILAGMMTFSLSASRVPVQPQQPSISQASSGEPDSDPSIPLQSGSCMAILQAAGQQAGVVGDTSLNSFDGLNGFGMISCTLSYREQIGTNRQALGTGIGLNDVGDRYETFSHRECRNSDELPNDSSYLFDFHGYLAIMETYVSEKTRTHDTDDIVHSESKTIFWYMDGGGDYCYSLSVRTYSDSVEEYGHARDPTPIADVLWSIAEANLPLTPPAVNGSDPQGDPVLPGDNADPQAGNISPEEGNPLQPETPSDADTTDPGNTDFDIPLTIILGSFGIPMAGAAAGALVSAVLGTLTPGATTTAGTSSGPTAGKKTGDPVSTDPASEELPESPLPEKDAPPTDPPDPAAEEKPVEETPEEETDTDKDPEPEEQPPAAENTETKETSTEPEKPEPKKKAVSTEQIKLVKDDLKALNQQLLDENFYVLNPVQGDPTLIVHGITITTNKIWDYTGGWVTGSNGLTCEGYVDKTRDKVLQILKDRVPGAVLEEIVFYEDSTWNNDRSIADGLDSLVVDNHILFKVILPDGSEWAIDFHQHNNGSGPIFRTWEGGKNPWKDYMGSEFRERTRKSRIAAPKPTRNK